MNGQSHVSFYPQEKSPSEQRLNVSYNRSGCFTKQTYQLLLPGNKPRFVGRPFHSINLSVCPCFRVMESKTQKFKLCRSIYQYYVVERDQSSVAGTATGLQAGPSVVRIPVSEIFFPLLRSVLCGSGTHAASYSLRTGILSLFRGCSINMATYIHLLPRLRKGGVYLHPPYAFLSSYQQATRQKIIPTFWKQNNRYVRQYS